MRTTITLEPDVERLLNEAIHRENLTFKEAVNRAIRIGLAPARKHRLPFKQPVFSLGAEQNFRWDKALETAAALEDEELVRKLAQRK